MSAAVLAAAARIQATVVGRHASADDVGPHVYPMTTTARVDRRRGAIVDIHGRSLDGCTVHLSVEGFSPYCFIALPPGVERHTISAFVRTLNAALTLIGIQNEGDIERDARDALRDGADAVVAIECVEHVPIRLNGTYNSSALESFLRITFFSPRLMSAARALIEAMYEQRATFGNLEAGARSTLADVVFALRDAAHTSFGGDDDGDADDVDASAAPVSADFALFHTRDRDIEEEAPAPSSSSSSSRGAVVVDTRVARAAAAVLQEAAHRAGRLARAFQFIVDTPLELFEADMSFVKRFYVDLGCSPFECLVYDPRRARRLDSSFVDVALECSVATLSRHADASLHTRLPPVVALAFDIETLMPPARKVLQVGAHVGNPLVDANGDETISVGFTLGSLPPNAPSLAGVTLFTYATEAALLADVFAFAAALRPDVVLGHNSDTFDFPYLYDQAKALDVKPVPIGRTYRQPYIRDAHFSSKGQGRLEFKAVSIDGVLVLDSLKMFLRSTEPRHKLRNYTVAALSTKLIGDNKDDVKYSEIESLMQSPEGRERLLHYCLKDAHLPFRLIGRERMLFKILSLARLASATPADVNNNGVQGLLKGLFFRRFFEAQPRYIMLTLTAVARAAALRGFKGAFVMRMLRGLLRFIAVLDFASLYPSIIRTFNACWTTYVPDAATARRIFGERADECVWDVCEDAFPDLPREQQPRFVKATERPGIMPAVLAMLGEGRKAAKGRAKAALARAAAAPEGSRERADAEFDAVRADMEQLAIKVIMNSVYGILGSSTSWGFLLALAAFVTALGRQENVAMCKYVSSVYAPAHGLRITTVYGDTDSGFFRIDDPATPMTLERAVAIAVDIEHDVNAMLQRKYGERADNVLIIEAEKVYDRFLGVTSKRYAGRVAAIAGGRAGPLKTKSSGLESDRRDSVRFVADVVAHVLHLLLDDGDDVDTATRTRRVAEYMRYEVLDALAAGDVSWERFIKSSKLSRRIADYTQKTLPPHVDVAKRVNARAGVERVKPGDRVQYVPVVNDVARNKSAAHEDPEYAWTHGMRLDVRSFIDEVLPPVARLLAPALIDPTRAPPVPLAFLDDADEEAEVQNEKAVAADDLAALRSVVASVPPRGKRARVTIAPLAAQAPAAAPVRGLFARARRRCRMCADFVDAPGADLCATHAADASVVEETRAATAAATAALDATLEAHGRTCAACKAVPFEPVARVVADIEDAYSCGNTDGCDVFWQRRYVKRRRRGGAF